MWKNKHVRDLAWLLSSAPMLEEPGPELSERWCKAQFSADLLEFHENWLLQMDENPLEIDRFMFDSEKMLLGKHYELLFEFLLRHSPFFEFRSGNIQLNNDGVTHSELDFLAYYKPLSRWIHFEISCKYYLGYTNSSRLDQWIGPNSNDSLAVRMQKFNKQLALLDGDSNMEIIKEMRSLRSMSLGWLKGFLFVPYNLIGNHKLPKGVSNQCSVGWYMKPDDMFRFDSTPAQWLILPRHQWISPWSGDPENEKLHSGKDLHEILNLHFSHSTKAMMIVQLDPMTEYRTELSRGFIVNPKWPTT